MQALAQAQDADNPNSLINGRKWAVVVGISQYENNEVPQLQFPAEDAKAFYTYLRSDKGLNMSPDQIVILLNAEATVANIRSALGDFVAKQARPEDTVLFFFAGHGGVEVDFLAGASPEQAKFLLAYDTAPDKFYGTGVNMKDDLAYVFEHRIQAKQILCFLDCCHAGAAQGAVGRSVRGRGITVTEKLQVSLDAPVQELPITAGAKRLMIATACKPNETALEVSALKHGVFTYVALQALAGAADTNKDAAVSISEFSVYVSAQAVKLTKDRQHPQFTISMGGGHLLSQNANGAPLLSTTEPYGSSSLWQPLRQTAAAETSNPAIISQMIAEDDYLAEIRQDKDRVLIAVVGSSEKTKDVLDALGDARRKQRLQIRKYFQLDPDATEALYRKGEVIDAKELGNRTWYLVMGYPRG